MGGLWVDYNLMSTIPGLFVTGEANFSDHGANRLGASALMQGLADGYFIIPYTVGDYLAREGTSGMAPSAQPFAATLEEVNERVTALMSVGGKRTPDAFHRELGRLLWDTCGMARNAAGLQRAIEQIPELRRSFWSDLKITGQDRDLNQTLERAGRVADFLEFAELMAHDALEREESCGGHFREESQTSEGEALRDDEHYSHVTAWEFTGVGERPTMHKEPLSFEYVSLTQRSYK
jgi:succinate dehydrogenase / fumarate reductase flavoprotein subunit